MLAAASAPGVPLRLRNRAGGGLDGRGHLLEPRLVQRLRVDEGAVIVPFPERPDPYAGYGGPCDRHPSDVGDGDLIYLDDTDIWVIVEAAEPDVFNDTDTNIAWRTIDDSDDAGSLILTADALIATRRLVDDDVPPEKPVRPVSLTGRRRQKAKGPRP